MAKTYSVVPLARHFIDVDRVTGDNEWVYFSRRPSIGAKCFEIDLQTHYTEESAGAGSNGAVTGLSSRPNIFPFTATFALLFPVIGMSFTRIPVVGNKLL
jgi:hypothetical protein